MLIYQNLWVSALPMGKGECIRIRFLGDSGKFRNLVVDSGPTCHGQVFRELYRQILRDGEQIDMLVITHYDDDHIGGILQLTQMDSKLQISQVYFNAVDGSVATGNLTAAQNQRLFHHLLAADGAIHSSALRGQKIHLDGAVITVIAPGEEELRQAKAEMEKAERQLPLAGSSDWRLPLDTLQKQPYPAADASISNRASIAFCLEYQNQRFLFTGDAPAKSLTEGLGTVQQFDLVKLPHHGSSRNLSEQLLQFLDCYDFLICADGSTHPNKLTIAKLLAARKPVRIFGNYSWWCQNFLTTEDKHYLNEGLLQFANICANDVRGNK